jgi:hypothetical protein
MVCRGILANARLGDGPAAFLSSVCFQPEEEALQVQILYPYRAWPPSTLLKMGCGQPRAMREQEISALHADQWQKRCVTCKPVYTSR